MKIVQHEKPDVPPNGGSPLPDATAEATRAFGKLILLGEHFVVYHVPALVGAVSAFTDCVVQEVEQAGTVNAGDVIVVDKRPAVPNYKTKKQDEAEQALMLVLEHLKIKEKLKDNNSLSLTFGGDLCCASGIGASAAQVVALARALNQKYGLQLSEDEINRAGYEGEKGYHGTPSGIDNTAATFGGVLKFQRRKDADGNPMDPLFERQQVPKPLLIVYASTGITASTTEVVGDVRAKKEADPAWFDNLLQQYLQLVPKAETAIATHDVATLADCMNQNHALLQQLTVSCSELDALVDAARQAGAVGAKMSGTGRGGLMVALVDTVEKQDAVAAALEKLAPQVWKTTFQ